MFACQKNEPRPNLTPQISTAVRSRNVPAATKDADLIMLSKAYAKANQNTSFRQFIERQVSQQFGGENSVLYFMVRDSLVHSGKTFAQILNDEAINTGNTLSFSYFQDSLLAHMPLLAFTVYTGTSDNEPFAGLFAQPLKALPWTEKMDSTSAEAFETGYAPNQSTTPFSSRVEPNEAVTIVEESPIFVLLDGNLKTPDNQDAFDAIGLRNECSTLRQALHAMTGQLPTSAGIIQSSSIGKGYNFFNQYVAIEVNAILSVYNTSGQPEMMGGDNCGIHEGSCQRDEWDGDEEITAIKVVESQLNAFCGWFHNNCKIEVTPTVFGQSGGIANIAAPSLLHKFINGKHKNLKNNQ